MREASEEDGKTRNASGIVPTGFSIRGPRTVPQVDYERIFVMDSNRNVLGEYALDDECPLEDSDLIRSLPVSGLRHLVSFYQGEYAFTPFKVDDLWFVILTRGVPRIEERGSVGTLLAAARIHIPPMIEPLLAKKELDLHVREQEIAHRESELARREQRAGTMESEIGIASTRLNDLEADIRSREAKLVALRDYAVQMQRTFVVPKEEKTKEPRTSGSLPATPA